MGRPEGVLDLLRAVARGELPRGVNLRGGTKAFLKQGGWQHTVTVVLDPAGVAGTPRSRASETFSVAGIEPRAVRALIISDVGVFARYARDPQLKRQFDFERARWVGRGWRVERRLVANLPAHRSPATPPQRGTAESPSANRAVWYSRSPEGTANKGVPSDAVSSGARGASTRPVPPAILALNEPARQLWTDSGARAVLAAELLDQWQRKDIRGYLAALKQMSSALTEGLSALGYPPGKVTGPWINRIDAQASVDYRLHIWLDDEFLEGTLTVDKDPEAIWVALLHEHLHARARFDPSEATLESFKWVGYEEGLTEALTRQVCEEAGLNYAKPKYQFYVASMEALAEVLELDLNTVLRELRKDRPGRVRAGFAMRITHLLQANGRSLGTSDRKKLELMADRLFSSKHANWSVKDTTRSTLVRILKRAF